MFALTVDQRRSRRTADAVPTLLADLALTYAGRLTLSFERTAGDEVQALVEDPAVVADLCADLLDDGRWWVGVGIGPVDHPRPDSVRAARGPAFVCARRAVERAKSAPQPVCVEGVDPGVAARIESALWLLASLLRRRSDAGRAAVEAMADHETQRAAASSMKISAQALNRRLAVAGWLEERRGRALVADLLREAT